MIILGITASSDKNAPSAPTIGTATDVGTGRAYNNAAVTVTFTAPTYSGGSPITSYTVTSNTGGYTTTGASSPLTVTGIPSNTSLTFTVTATNADGFTSPASSASNSVTATTVPQAPTIGTATALDASATVTFTAGATGGKAVSTFTATSSPSSITGTSATSPITVSGLANGTAYTFTVTATNANGTSTASAASNSVTPATSGNFEYLGGTTASGGETELTISGIPSTYKHLIIRATMWGSTSAQSKMQINGVANYGQQNFEAYNGTISASFQASTSSLYTGYLAVNGSTSGTYPNICEVLIPEYTKSSTPKNMIGTGGNSMTNAANNSIYQWSAATVSSINAITSVTFLRVTGTFGSGTNISIYGIGA